MSTSVTVVSAGSKQSTVTPKQSQKLVQTMLIMSFGCITYLRGLFDEGCFNDQKYYPNKSSSESVNGMDSSNSIKVKTLVRGKSEKIDALLDWLDKGVFPLIASKYLKALSFSIYLDESHPLDLAESYAFSFDYSDDGVRMNIESQAKSRKDNIIDSFSLVDSRKEVEQLMRKLIILTQSLPSLPLTRNLSIRLLFNDRCPLDYQPSELFKDISEDAQPKITLDKLEVQERTATGNFKTPFHQVGFKVLNSNTEGEGSFKLIQIDPFEIHDEKFNIDVPSRVTTLYQPKLKYHQASEETNVSQITSELKTFLRKQSRSGSSVKPTQALEEMEFQELSQPEEVGGFNCECGSRFPLDSIEFRKLQCPACHKNKHISCYGFELNFKNVPHQFKCYTCRAKEQSKKVHPELSILMNVRKIYRIIQKTDIPESVSELVMTLAFSIENNDAVETVIKAINVLVHDGILVFTQEPIRKRGGRKLHLETIKKINNNNFIIGSDYINVDIKGISDGLEEMQLGKIGLIFTPLLCRYQRSTHDYSLVVKERKDFYFNQTLSICCDEEENISQRSASYPRNSDIIEQDLIVDDSLPDTNLFENLAITKELLSEKRKFVDEVETHTLSTKPNKSRKISSNKSDVRFH